MAKMKTLVRWNDLPEFGNDTEEGAYWAEHQIDPQLMNGSRCDLILRCSAELSAWLVAVT